MWPAESHLITEVQIKNQPQRQEQSDKYQYKYQIVSDTFKMSLSDKFDIFLLVFRLMPGAHCTVA